MPDQKLKRTGVNLKRDSKFRKGINKISFNEARRQRGPIYDALVRELFEEGCTTVACHFQRLAEEEGRLRRKKNIICAVFEEPEFLVKLFDNVKNAELAARLGQCNGMLACLKLLYQTMVLVENYSINSKYDWLLNDIYEIIIAYVIQLDPELIILNEMKAKIYFKYGSYFAHKGDRLEWLIEVLTKALDLCKGQIWDSEPFDEIRNSLHEVVARRLAKVYLAHAKSFLPDHPETAMHLAMKAILTIAECGLEKNKELLCSAYLAKIEFLIECHKFEMALKDIRKVRNQIGNDDRFELIKIKCVLFKFKGICHYNLHQTEKAFENFQRAYTMSRNYGLRSLMGQIWLEIGKTHVKSSVYKARARNAFEMARSIFRKMEDFENMKTAEYMLAKLRADKIFPQLMRIIKSKEYCDFYCLRQWKNRVEPFWEEQDDPLLMQKSIMTIKSKMRASNKSVISEMRPSHLQPDRTSVGKQKRLTEESDMELSPDEMDNLECLLAEEGGKRQSQIE